LFMIQQTNPTLFATVFSITSGGPGDPTAGIVPGTNIKLSNYRFGVDPLPTIPAAQSQLSAGNVGRLLDPNYRNPYTQQFNVGYAYQLTPTSVIEVEYTHVLGLRESKTININPQRIALLAPGSTGTPPRPLDAAFVAAGLPKLGRIDVESSVGRSRYDGLNISYRRRLTQRFSVNASYVLSRAVGYNGDAAAFRDRATDVDNIFAAHDFGPTPNDERHRFVVSGLVDLPKGIQIAPIMQIASARPYDSRNGPADVFGFGGGTGAVHAIVNTSDPSNLLANKGKSVADLRACLAAGTCEEAPYDNLRGQAFFQLDARVSKDIKFGERFKLKLLFQAFDLTNRANFGNNFDGNINSSTFGKPTGFITPSGVFVPRSFSGEFGAQFIF
ncbi:MAG: hypothetical protein J2P52_00115, partial [Blastocatellia bacterium]|nr:hypothetical protein [Blastocatellia bacterium]